MARTQLVRALLASACIGGALFLISGAWEDPWLWAYVAGLMAILVYGVATIDGDLARERFRPPSRGADAAWLAAVQIVGASHLVLGALDLGRWHLSNVPPAARALALPVMVGCAILIFRAMHANRFFSSVIRIQADRGHSVVERGPYSVVRHPGYAGMIPLMASSGLALGSWIAFGLGLVYGALILRRVAFEDRFLQTNLDGYREYVERVRYRLVPGIW